jgi:hypothetical protein
MLTLDLDLIFDAKVTNRVAPSTVRGGRPLARVGSDARPRRRIWTIIVVVTP